MNPHRPSSCRSVPRREISKSASSLEGRDPFPGILDMLRQGKRNEDRVHHERDFLLGRNDHVALGLEGPG
jgi:hypothetical protein